MVATHASGHDMAPNGAGNGRQGGHDREAQRRGPALMPGEQARGAVDDAAPMTSHDAGMIRDPGEAPGARKDAPPAADAVATGGRLPRDGAGRMGDVTGVGGVEGTRGEAGEAVALKRAAGGDGKAEAAASGRQGGGGGVPSNGVPEVEVSEITLATMTPEVGGGGRGRGRGRGRGGKDANRIKPRPGARRAALGPMLKAMRTSGHI